VFFFHLTWKRTFMDKWHTGCYYRRHPANSVKALKEAQSTDLTSICDLASFFIRPPPVLLTEAVLLTLTN